MTKNITDSDRLDTIIGLLTILVKDIYNRYGNETDLRKEIGEIFGLS